MESVKFWHFMIATVYVPIVLPGYPPDIPESINLGCSYLSSLALGWNRYSTPAQTMATMALVAETMARTTLTDSSSGLTWAPSFSA